MKYYKQIYVQYDTSKQFIQKHCHFHMFARFNHPEYHLTIKVLKLYNYL